MCLCVLNTVLKIEACKPKGEREAVERHFTDQVAERASKRAGIQFRTPGKNPVPLSSPAIITSRKPTAGGTLGTQEGGPFRSVHRTLELRGVLPAPTGCTWHRSVPPARQNRVDSCLTRPQAGVPLAVLTSFLAAAGRGRERGREGGATAGRRSRRRRWLRRNPSSPSSRRRRIILACLCKWPIFKARVNGKIALLSLYSTLTSRLQSTLSIAHCSAQLFLSQVCSRSFFCCPWVDKWQMMRCSPLGQWILNNTLVLLLNA